LTIVLCDYRTVLLEPRFDEPEFQSENKSGHIRVDIDSTIQRIDGSAMNDAQIESGL
jgi:hypothetical protein